MIARAEMVQTVRHAKGWISKVEAGDTELRGESLQAVADAAAGRSM